MILLVGSPHQTKQSGDQPRFVTQPPLSHNPIICLHFSLLASHLHGFSAVLKKHFVKGGLLILLFVRCFFSPTPWPIHCWALAVIDPCSKPNKMFPCFFRKNSVQSNLIDKARISHLDCVSLSSAFMQTRHRWLNTVVSLERLKQLG